MKAKCRRPPVNCSRCRLAYAAASLRAGGAMNSGPTASLIVACLENAIDLRLGRCVKVPASYLADRLQLAGVACTSQRGGDALIEHPADRQMDHVLAEALLG
jgi:hypothetical protein